jgi:hypothetical protein
VNATYGGGIYFEESKDGSFSHLRFDWGSLNRDISEI